MTRPEIDPEPPSETPAQPERPDFRFRWSDLPPLSAALPGSVALVRMEPWLGRAGVLAFASADPDGFAPDMSAELTAHLARVVERISTRWPVL